MLRLAGLIPQPRVNLRLDLEFDVFARRIGNGKLSVWKAPRDPPGPPLRRGERVWDCVSVALRRNRQRARFAGWPFQADGNRLPRMPAGAGQCVCKRSMRAASAGQSPATYVRLTA